VLVTKHTRHKLMIFLFKKKKKKVAQGECCFWLVDLILEAAYGIFLNGTVI
jgi:hypothetical protein